MEINQVLQQIAVIKPGAFTRVCWKSYLGSSTAKRLGYVIEKRTETTGRIGIHYKNIASVKARQQEAQPTDKTYTVWFKHVEGHPEIVEHLKDAARRYLQIFSVKNAYPKIRYFLDGEEISKAELEATGLCTKSDLAPSSSTEVFNIPIENLIFVGGQRQ